MGIRLVGAALSANWSHLSERARLVLDRETLTLRNEVVWDKGNIPGMASAGLTQYPEASERCLFFHTAELSPAYVDTTVRRWQQHTGGTPQRNGVPHSLEP